MPKSNQAKKTWRYDHTFKASAVQLSYLEGIMVSEVATSLDIHPYVLSRWRKEYREGKIMIDKRKKLKGLSKEVKELNRVKQLESENSRLKLENELLKKWQRFLAEEHQSVIDSSKETDN